MKNELITGSSKLAFGEINLRKPENHKAQKNQQNNRTLENNS